jgi:hypothetical protein
VHRSNINLSKRNFKKGKHDISLYCWGAHHLPSMQRKVKAHKATMPSTCRKGQNQVPLSWRA